MVPSPLSFSLYKVEMQKYFDELQYTQQVVITVCSGLRVCVPQNLNVETQCGRYLGKDFLGFINRISTLFKKRPRELVCPLWPC